MADLKRVTCDAIDKYAEDLCSLSMDNWEHPELDFQEFYSYDYLAKFLEDKGFIVDRKYKILIRHSGPSLATNLTVRTLLYYANMTHFQRLGMPVDII